MNTKKMIAVFAVLAMALAAFAFVPGEDVSAADDDFEIVEVKSGVLTEESSITGEKTQKIIIKENLIVNGTIIIYGDFYVPEGVTVTIEKGSVTINGSATIDGTIVSKVADGLVIEPETDAGEAAIVGEVVVNGMIRTAGEGESVSITADDATKNVIVNGEVVVGGNTTVALENVYFEAGSKLTAYGDVTGPIFLAGTAIFDGKVTILIINIAETSAEIDIVSNTGAITVTDAGMFAYALGGTQYYVEYAAGTPAYAPANSAVAQKYDADNETLGPISANTIILTDVENVKITENVVTGMAYDKSISQDVKVAETSMNILALDGEKTVSGPSATGTIEVSAGGETVNFGDMDIDEIAVTIGAAAKVTGTVNYFNPATGAFSGAGPLTVTGLLALKTNPAAVTTINAAYFSERVDGDRYHYYTTLAQAIELEAKDIKMLGEFIVDEDITIPADVKVDASGTGVVAVVKKGATLTIDAGAAFKTGEVTVEGALDIKDSTKNVSITEIVADVKTVAEPEEFYSNIYVAFEKAKAGDKLQAYNPTSGIAIDEDIVLPAGVEFKSVDKSNAAVTIKVAKGAVFCIDGKLTLEEIGNLAAEGEWYSKTPAIKTAGGAVEDYSVISIGDEGVLEYDGFGTLSDAAGVYGEYFIAGAYFTKTVLGTAVNYITNVPLAFAGILDAEGKEVNIYGDVVIDAPVAGTEKDLVTVNLNGSDSTKMTLVGFTFKNAKITAIDANITGDIGTANGKIVFDDAVVNAEFGEMWINDAMNFFVNDTEGEDAVSIEASNPTSISGNVYFKNVTYAAPDDVAENADITFTVPAGAALYILGTVEFSGADLAGGKKVTQELIVEGDLVVTNMKLEGNDGASSLTAETVSILGTATVVNLDGRAGTLTADIIMVGGSSDSFAVFKYEADGEAVLAGSGAVSVTEDTGALFVFNGATITADILLDWMENDTVNTEFFVDGALWMTAYTENDDMYAIAETTAATDTTPASTEYFLVPALENMTFKAWQTYDEKAKAFKDIKTDAYVGAAGFETVYASIDKEIYNIYVVADVGIDDVSIDGKLMVKNGTTHYAVVAAGVHTLSYTLANGYSGNAVITTIDGEPLLGAGLSFEVNDLKYDDAKGVMVITLSGVEKSGIDVDPETHPEKPAPGLTTTEILLIVVVIIMAIMAVVLILRLNRS